MKSTPRVTWSAFWISNGARVGTARRASATTTGPPVVVTVKDQAPADGRGHILLVRQSTSMPSNIEYFLAHAASAAPIPELIGVAGMR